MNKYVKTVTIDLIFFKKRAFIAKSRVIRIRNK